jgi:hypothetical protein
MSLVLEVTNPRQLMHTPHGLRTVQDLYDSLDSCIDLHKIGKRVQAAALAHLDNPTVDTKAALVRALQDHDIVLAMATKIAEYEAKKGELPSNGARLEATNKVRDPSCV